MEKDLIENGDEVKKTIHSSLCEPDRIATRLMDIKQACLSIIHQGFTLQPGKTSRESFSKPVSKLLRQNFDMNHGKNEREFAIAKHTHKKRSARLRQ